jgi:hypothetical protein
MIPGLWVHLKVNKCFSSHLEYSESPRGFGSSTIASTEVLARWSKVGTTRNGFEDFEKVQLTSQ